jgi:facilitated trehalose transporter
MIKSIGWLPLVSLVTYIIAFAIGSQNICIIFFQSIFSIFLIISGFGPITWALNAELYAPESKRLCASIAVAFNWICAFLVTKFEVDVENVIGLSGVFFCFAAICFGGAKTKKSNQKVKIIDFSLIFLGIFVILFLLPETKGRTADEMKTYFLHGKYANNNNNKL